MPTGLFAIGWHWRARGLKIIDGPHVTGWYQQPCRLAASCQVWIIVRGWLGIARHYAVTAEVYFKDAYVAKRPGENVYDAMVRVGVNIMFPNAVESLRDKIKHDFTTVDGRWDAANADFVNWSNARWRLLDTMIGEELALS